MAQLGQIRQHPARLMKPLQQMQISKRWFCRSKDDATTSTGGTVKKLSMSSSSPTVGVDPNSSPQIIDINIGGRDFLVGSDQYFDFSKSFKRSESWRSKLVSTMLVYPNFISGEEELLILKEIEPYLSRLHYEESHWDDAIHSYRETERSKWNKKNEVIINRIRGLAFPPEVPQLKLVHILDLAKNGVIKPHIDSIRFCGNTIAGLSLLSDCVMRLRHEVQKDFYCDILLPRLSLYMMRNFARYEFTHEILGDADSTFKTSKITRNRRISIICRNEPTITTNSNQTPVFTPLNET